MVPVLKIAMNSKNKTMWYLVWLLAIFIVYPSSGWSKIVPASKAIDSKILGDHYLRQGNARLAIEEYKKGVTLNPSSTATYFNLSIAYFSEKNLPEAISALDKLLQLDSHDTEAWYNLACLKLYEGKLEEAALYLKKAYFCCDSSSFATKIDSAFEYIKELSTLPSPAQALALFTLQLQQGLTPTPVML